MDNMDDTFSSDDEQAKDENRMRVTPDHRAFALAVKTIHSKRMELPTITRLL